MTSMSIMGRAGKFLPTATPGTAGDDFIRGSKADEVVSGRAGNDTIIGGGGDDRIDGGAGDDTITANWTDDDADGIRARLSGGTGDDTFIFRGVSSADDVPERDLAWVLDFEPGETIRLDMWTEDASGWLDRITADDVTVREAANSKFYIEGLDGFINANDTIVVSTSQPMTLAEIEAALVFG